MSGNGSGAAHRDGCKSILQAFIEQGLLPEEGLAYLYREKIAAEGEKDPDAFDWSMAGQYINSGIMYEIFGKYHAPKAEPDVPEELFKEASEGTDTAVWILGRNSGGEECDRHLEGDYYLTESERQLIGRICAFFPKVVLILNVNGLVDLAWTKEYEAIRSILFLGIPGEEGADALAELVSGEASPCGKLAVTIAENYEDYPAARDFTWDKEDEGKLKTYESYGLDAAENGSVGFRKSPVTVYREGIYLGYRYFSIFGKDFSTVKTSLYPFGYGLSYTTFSLNLQGVEEGKDKIVLNVEAENTGERAGRETVQVYLSVECREIERLRLELMDGKIEGPEQAGREAESSEPRLANWEIENSKSEFVERELERPGLALVGWEKTKLLERKEKTVCRVEIPWERFACYDEEQAAWVIPAGSYRLLVGNSSENLQEAVKIPVEKRILVKQCKNRLGLRDCNRGKLEFLRRGTEDTLNIGKMPETEGISNTGQRTGAEETPEAVRMSGALKMPGTVQILDAVRMSETVKSDTERMPEAAQKANKEQIEEGMGRNPLPSLSLEELASLCVGYGPGVPFAAFGDGSEPATVFDEAGNPLTENDHPTGFAGYVSPAIKEKGIHSVFYKDGPAGIGQFAWPCEMLTACSFDRELWYAFGEEMGRECEAERVDVWLAPAMNLHRHPLCGRNFEYFSEDPLLAGICGCEIARGVQENHPVLVCAKHFAANEQETWRRGSAGRQYDAADSILEERTLRELYLKPFELMVREASLQCIMTSFNKINGTFAAGSRELCTEILREEWGFSGLVVTDWGDMDVVVDGADAVHAGNDIVMPGGPPVIRQILQGHAEGRVSREDLERSVRRLLRICDRARLKDRT
ncbi:MAG: glycoside hydrolase family 3 C-terminal domain-containing protein [Roseburia sp.]|nr:glycoside hydrolase family 3 C-terminal domain-containing protein [Roseburia sp.]MCM1098967.1 glycoside hydrolase family 3 C-terminal domain-containing protein [Ruminococcus flavefaciens]